MFCTYFVNTNEIIPHKTQPIQVLFNVILTARLAFHFKVNRTSLYADRKPLY